MTELPEPPEGMEHLGEDAFTPMLPEIFNWQWRFTTIDGGPNGASVVMMIYAVFGGPLVFIMPPFVADELAKQASAEAENARNGIWTPPPGLWTPPANG